MKAKVKERKRLRPKQQQQLLVLNVLRFGMLLFFLFSFLLVSRERWCRYNKNEPTIEWTKLFIDGTVDFRKMELRTTTTDFMPVHAVVERQVVTCCFSVCGTEFTNQVVVVLLVLLE